MLMDYHLVFIMMAFVTLLVSIAFIFIDTTPQKIIAAMLLCGINTTLCTINYLSFFGIDIIGYVNDGSIEVTMYSDMFPLFMFFFGLYWVNVILIFYCWYKYTFTAWTKEV